uniref:Uncharacterized protein n=1 Tax=Kalanchoe fedtschenkoi TaxID=63787 RepID=A0A7N0UWF0_KALFE
MVVADDDSPSETSTRRSKRTRVQTQRHGHAAAESGEKHSGPSDDMPILLPDPSEVAPPLRVLPPPLLRP